MKVLVTGGAGFIGSHVVDRYLADGCEVCVVDNLSTGRRANLNPRAIFYEVDIASLEITQVIARERPEVINHHAAQIDVRKSVTDPVADCQTNIGGFLQLMEAARHYGCRKVIFASSGGTVYGEQEQFPATETHPTRPISPYGIAKLTTELYLHFYAMQYGIASIVLRYANIYGPRQNADGEAGVVAIFARQMLADQQPMLHGDGRQTRDFTYVGDVVVANRLALHSEATGAFNIGTGLEHDVHTLFRMMKELSNASCPVLYGPPRMGEQSRSMLDFGRANALLGWRPTVSLFEGLRRTIAWFRNPERIEL